MIWVWEKRSSFSDPIRSDHCCRLFTAAACGLTELGPFVSCQIPVAQRFTIQANSVESENEIETVELSLIQNFE